jgi:hypothetical protein
MLASIASVYIFTFLLNCSAGSLVGGFYDLIERLPFKFGNSRCLLPFRSRPASCFVLAMALQRKKVYVNDRLIGEASSWAEIHELFRTRGLSFLSMPDAAEGPLAFFICARPPLERAPYSVISNNSAAAHTQERQR